MTEAEIPIEVEEITSKWMHIANAVAYGRLDPEEGVARLQDLAQANPADRDWLQDEIETIRRQFGLDVAERIHKGQGDYWDQLRAVIDALLDDRLDHDRALSLLEFIDAQHPEHTDNTQRLISGVANSPLRRMVGTDG
jgi:hypothetical protein